MRSIKNALELDEGEVAALDDVHSDSSSKLSAKEVQKDIEDLKKQMRTAAECCDDDGTVCLLESVEELRSSVKKLVCR